MKKPVIFILLTLCSLQIQAKFLYWESRQVGKAYYPSITCVNTTKYDLEIATLTDPHSTVSWTALPKTKEVSVLLPQDFKELKVRIAYDSSTEEQSNNLTVPADLIPSTGINDPLSNDVWMRICHNIKFQYDFTKELEAELATVQKFLHSHKKDSAHIACVFKEISNPFKIDKAGNLKLSRPNLKMNVQLKAVYNTNLMLVPKKIRFS